MHPLAGRVTLQRAIMVLQVWLARVHVIGAWMAESNMLSALCLHRDMHWLPR